MEPPAPDKSNGWEAVAKTFIACRNQTIGCEVVREWAAELPPGASILELGCGPGEPLSKILIEGGFALHAIDASPTLMHAFRQRFPKIPTECAAAEASNFFDRDFDAVLAVGLLFLLRPESQEQVIRHVGRVLRPGGRFLFTAPEQILQWEDVLTKRESVSLGYDAYRALLESTGMSIINTCVDEGENFHYSARRH